MCDALRDVVAKKIERQEELRRVGPQNMTALAIQRGMRGHLQVRAKAALMIQRIVCGVVAHRKAKKKRHIQSKTTRAMMLQIITRSQKLSTRRQ